MAVQNTIWWLFYFRVVTFIKSVLRNAVTESFAGAKTFNSNIPAQKMKFYYKLYYHTIQIV